VMKHPENVHPHWHSSACAASRRRRAVRSGSAPRSTSRRAMFRCGAHQRRRRSDGSGCLSH
jgi:hypothetical protein